MDLNLVLKDFAESHIGVANLSYVEEAVDIYSQKQEICQFTSSDYNALLSMFNTAQFESDEYQDLFEQYINYLYEVVENFEQGPLGLKANLDENDYLNVPERNDSERFFSLARKGSRRPFTDDEQDEFYDLFVRFAASLQNMAIDAQERGLDCWILPEVDETPIELDLRVSNNRTGCYKRRCS